jgi:hypothetical protein
MAYWLIVLDAFFLFALALDSHAGLPWSEPCWHTLL